MFLVLARFLFGFTLAVACALLLVAATWLATRLIALSIRHLHTSRSQDTASGLIVLGICAAAIAAAYACGHYLHGAIGTGQASDWLAGADPVSPAAVLGALMGLGTLAYLPGLWQRRAAAGGPASPRKAAKEKTATKSVGPEDDEPAPRARRTQAASAGRARQSAAPAPRGPRIPQLGWAAIFLLALGATLLAFAFIVAPLWPADASATAVRYAGRARPVYLAGSVLVGGGALCLLAWIFVRRAPAASR